MPKMNIRGFLPLTTTGVVLLILSSSIAAHLLWKNHEKKMQEIMKLEVDELDWRVSFVCASVKETLRWAAERALLEASQRAEQYHPNVEEAAGGLASIYFMEYLQRVIGSLQDIRTRVNFPALFPVVGFSNAGDFVVARAYFPSGLLIEIRNPEGTIVASKKIWRIEAPIKVRFFLLENLMDNFIKNHRVKVAETLEKALYLKAWGEAWTDGIVYLDRSSDEMLFRFAWCTAEEETFGSADWLDASGFEFPIGIKLASSEVRKLKELKSLFAQIYEIVSSSRQKLDGAVGGNVNLKIVEENLENAIKLLQNIQNHEKSEGIINKVVQGMCRRPENGIPSVVEQLEIGISKLIDEIKTAQQMLELDEAEKTENILRKILSSTKPREICIDHEIAGEKIQGIFKIYFDENSPPSIVAVLELLSGILSELAKISPPELGFELHYIQPDIPDTNREILYRMFPPKPKRHPFVSVYHNLKIKSVEYHREDLLGAAGGRTATPVYLPFLDTVVWWGQWSVLIKVDEGVEEIFDYPHQNLLQKTSLGYIHSSLSYRWSFEEERFSVRVVVISPEPFYFSEI